MVAKDASIAKGTPHPEIPDEHLIFGMGAVFLRVRYLEASLGHVDHSFRIYPRRANRLF